MLLAESDGRRESLLDFFRASGVNPPVFDSLAEFQADATEKVGIATSSLMTGFAWVEEGLDFVTETELFASSPTGRRRRRQEQVSDVEALIKDLSELKVGDPIVHSDHGIGRYRGLINMDMGQKNPDGTPALQEFLHLEYAADAVLYVPVSQLHLISRYTGVSPDDAPLHKLGGTQWESQAPRRRTGARLGCRAAQHLRAPRRAPGPCLPLPHGRLRAVCGRLRLRGNGRPARRHPCRGAGHDFAPAHGPPGLWRCGLRQDRGRAARGLCGGHGRQAGRLPGPTTLLAEQHYQTLVDRFSKWPIKVAEVSRFRSGKEITAAIKGISDGTVDIVVGTHKLLSESTQFKNLGLLIIDEEHRFGVRHKEAMKAMRAEVDVLTLTATRFRAPWAWRWRGCATCR